MRRFVSTVLTTALLFWAVPAAASQPTVVVSRPSADEFARWIEPAPASHQRTQPGLGVASAPSSNEPSTESWFVPFIVDTGNSAGATTLFSVTNEVEFGAGASPNVLAEFHDAFNSPFHSQELTLSSGQLQSFNVRDQPNLSPGRAVGFVEIHSAAGALPSVDYYQVTPDEDFATGGLGLQLDDFCRRWRARVLIGGPFTGGTDLLFFVNGPMGIQPEDEPTVVGVVYEESGTPVHTFAIHTDAYVFEVDAEDLVDPPNLFGYLELLIRSDFQNPSGGYVIVNTGAEGRYSVGTTGICRDDVPSPP